MTTKNKVLDRLSIPSPCSADWSSLIGDGRKRYCEQCDRHVYDFSKMTATEAVALLLTLQGRVCARLTRQADGSVLTEEPLPVLPVVRRHASPFAGIALTTLITITATPVGRPSAQAGSVQSNLDKGTRIPDQTPLPGDTTASIVGTVSDQNRAVIPGAIVSLISQTSGDMRVITSSDAGEFRFSGLGEGLFTVRIESPGFSMSETQSVKIVSQQEQRVDVTMEVGQISMGGDVVVNVARPLRALYNQSDLIVVARIGESKTVETERDARLIKTTLHLSSIWKGASNGSTVTLFHWSFGDLAGPFVAGDEMLLFLSRSEPQPGRKSRGGYEVHDTEYGIKKVAGTDLKAYLDRIAELSQLRGENGPIDAAIVEWLVRCAEDPATRWEGAYELASRIDRQSGADQDTESIASTSENDQPDEEAERHDVDEDPDFLALITVEQKTRLMTALVQTEEVQSRDQPLIELAQYWKEPRLVPFLTGQLHLVVDRPPRLAGWMMRVLAAALNEKALAELAEDYETKVSYPDEEVEHQPGETLAESTKAARDERAAASIQTRCKMLAMFLQAVEVALAERQFK